jgi:hypothetical protein
MMADNPDTDVGAICLAPSILDCIEPRADLSDALQSRFARFRAVCSALRTSFSE